MDDKTLLHKQTCGRGWYSNAAVHLFARADNDSFARCVQPTLECQIRAWYEHQPAEDDPSGGRIQAAPR